MEQNLKELLLKDLCARLPYGVKVQPSGSASPHKFVGYDKGLARIDIDQRFELENIKPYLRPMSSMTEKECIELGNINATIENISEVIPNVPYYIEVAYSKQIDWLNAHHFDYRGLIEKGLAIKVTKENNPYKE